MPSRCRMEHKSACNCARFHRVHKCLRCLKAAWLSQSQACTFRDSFSVFASFRNAHLGSVVAARKSEDLTRKNSSVSCNLQPKMCPHMQSFPSVSAHNISHAQYSLHSYEMLRSLLWSSAGTVTHSHSTVTLHSLLFPFHWPVMLLFTIQDFSYELKYRELCIVLVFRRICDVCNTKILFKFVHFASTCGNLP
jgi:hypothetical protein